MPLLATCVLIFPLEIDQRAKDHADEGGYDNT